MGKLLGGFLVGFFLATFLFSLTIYLILSPYSAQITQIYQLTHSEWYNGAIGVINSINSIANALSNIPFANLLSGGTINTASEWSGSLTQFLLDVKQTSEALYFLMSILVPAMVISIIMVIIGIVMIVRSKDEKRVHKGEGPHCQHCGAKLKKDDRFCGECGKKV